MKFTLISLVLAIASYGSYVAFSYAYDEFKTQQSEWYMQNKCIASKVSLGIERKDIIRVGSSDCEVVTDHE